MNGRSVTPVDLHPNHATDIAAAMEGLTSALTQATLMCSKTQEDPDNDALRVDGTHIDLESCVAECTSTKLGGVQALTVVNKEQDDILNILYSMSDPSVKFEQYESELQMPEIMRLIQKDLSEPYSIYTYRYFIHNWPKLCYLAKHGDEYVGAIVCKLDYHKKIFKRGYIAMLAVDERFRKMKIGTGLVARAVYAMQLDGADEVVLETEITNKAAQKLYENLGFVRDKRLFRYYLNGRDALRLKLWLR